MKCPFLQRFYHDPKTSENNQQERSASETTGNIKGPCELIYQVGIIGANGMVTLSAFVWDKNLIKK